MAKADKALSDRTLKRHLTVENFFIIAPKIKN
jgi:hypothetical protein